MSRLALVLLAACASVPNLPPSLRDIEAEHASAVHLVARCGGQDFDPDAWDSERAGTGVVVDGRHVLTAAHLVGCPYVPLVSALLPGSTYAETMVVERDGAMFGDGSDVARLVVLADDVLGRYAPPRLGLAGDAPTPWCVATWRGPACGEPIYDASASGAVRVRTERGDSGAGVYDARGRLLGIVTEGSEHATRFTRVGEEWLR